jgi:NitT/TauT family transport system substrate-binding protein
MLAVKSGSWWCVALLLLAGCGGPAAASAPPSLPKPAVPASQGPCSGPMRKLTIGLSTIPSTAVEAPPFVAKSLGLFARRCIDAEIVGFDGGGSGALKAAVTQGEVLGNVPVSDVARGAKLRQLWVEGLRLPHQYVVAEDIHSPADLKGRKLAALGGGPASFHYVMSREMLKSGGLTVNDAQLVPGPIQSRLSWIATGLLDGIALNPEDVYLAQQQKPSLHVLTSLADLLPLEEYGPMGASEGLIERDPALVRDALATIIEAMRLMYRDRAAVLPIMAQATQRPEAAVAYAYDAITSHCVWPVNGGLVRERLDFMAQLSVDNGDVEAAQKPSFDQLVNRQVSDGALALAGGLATIGSCTE